MTIIAQLKINNIPILIGDLLVSGPERIGESSNIPTKGDIEEVFPSGSGYTITDLRQKLVLFNDNLAVGFSGDTIAMKTLINEIFQYIDIDSSLEGFIDLFTNDEYIKSVINDFDLSFVGYVICCNKCTAFHYNATSISLDHLNEMNVCGSNFETITNYVKQLPSSPKIIDGEFNNYTIAAIHGLGIINVLIGHELITNESLRNFFGGGYELIVLDGNKFLKIDNVIYTYWVVDIDENGISLHVPTKFFKYFYMDDFLLLYTVTFRDGDNPKQIVSDRSMHVISPLYKKINKEKIKDIPEPKLNADWYCHLVLVKMPNRVCRYINYLEKRSISNYFKFHYFNDSKDLGISIQPDFVKMLENDAQNIFRKTCG